MSYLVNTASWGKIHCMLVCVCVYIYVCILIMSIGANPALCSLQMMAPAIIPRVKALKSP